MGRWWEGGREMSGRGCREGGWGWWEGGGVGRGAEWAGSWDIQEVVSGAHVGQKTERSNGDLRVGWRARGGWCLGGEVEGGGQGGERERA